MISYQPFWELMEKRGVTTYFLRNKCDPNNINESTLLRMKRGDSVSTNTLDSLCKIFGCGLDEIVVFIDETKNGEKPM